ncbi:MAG TPA: hypothetical protein VFI54_14125 [Solirubrobacteraceae bacterium]|nr:hypothetical protein [Solirubrobacteraceae bacterium]
MKRTPMRRRAPLRAKKQLRRPKPLPGSDRGGTRLPDRRMTPALAAARPRGDFHRIARGDDAWAWPAWAYAGEDGTFGNRFDDPAGESRVLYASSPRVGAFLETLARYRTDPAIAAEYDAIAIEPEDADRYPTIPPGVVPAEWARRERSGGRGTTARSRISGTRARWRNSP